MRFYSWEGMHPSTPAGQVNGTHRWSLPGVRCPECQETWANAALAYPSVDLSKHPLRAQLEKPRLEKDFEAFERLRESVRSLSPGTVLEPGTRFGPIVGTARGNLGPIVQPLPWFVLMTRDAVASLQAEGIQGMRACRTELRFRQKHPPELLELELLPLGRFHAECIPPEQRRPCPRCGRLGFQLPEAPLLEAASLPQEVDVFRLASFPTVLVASERFVEGVRRLWPEANPEFRELPVR